MLISIHGDPLARLGGIQSGGQNVYVRQVALGLQSLGWEVDVFTHWQNIADKQQEKLGAKGKVIRLTAGHIGFIPKENLYQHVPAFIAEAIDYLKRSKSRYDIIHSNYWLSGIAGLSLRKYLGIPQVHTFHSLGIVKARETKKEGSDMFRRLEAERNIVQGVSHLVATAPEEIEILINDYGAPPEKIALIPCGVDPKLFYPENRQQSKKALGLTGKKVAIYVGRLEENKGLGTLLEALEILAKKNSPCLQDLRLIIVGGDDWSKNHLKKTLLSRGLTSWVTFVGAKSQEELPLYYRAADVCVVPSYYETFGLVAIEAMACGTPVIASRVGGLKFTVVDGATGYHVPPRDPLALAEKIEQILSNPIVSRKLGETAARRVHQIFTWPRLVENLSSLYETMISRNSGEIANALKTK